MRALAIASDNKAPQLPDVPLLKQQGVAGGEADAWLALFAPTKTPAPVLETLSKAILAAMTKPEVAANAVKQGIAVNLRPGPAFRAYQEAELAKWGDVVRIAKVKLDG